MDDIIWFWTKGNKKIFTKKTDIVDQAMKEGHQVQIIQIKPSRIIR